MRIKVGMKVEALITEAASNIGAWRAGEVVWGNGHSYVMRWSDGGGPDSERISRKFVRPSPPDEPLPSDLGVGDIVELFDGSLWKYVEVVRFVGGRQLDVKFVGSTEVVTADRSALRPRLTYGEKGWALIHKNDQIPIESAVPSRPIAGKNIKCKAVGDGIGNGASKFAAQAVKLGKTKRGNYPMDADIVRDVKRFHGNGENTNRLLVKREEPAARYDDGNIEVMDVHPSHYDLEKRQETGNNVEDCFLVRRTENDKDNDDDVSTSTSDTSSSSGDSSSSSSSSGSNNNGGDRGASAQYCKENQEAEIPLLPKCEEEEQDSDNRTESHASARMQHYPVNEVKVVMKQDEQEEQQHGQHVHGLELEAYMGVLKAFHAKGQLTWTMEELLCDLRLHLNVSSDEHMQVIWRLNGKKKPAGGPARNGHR